MPGGAINAIAAVLMAASDDETLHLGNWLRAGLVEAVHSIALTPRIHRLRSSPVG